MFSKRTIGPMLSRWRWWQRRCSARGIPPLPLTEDKLELAAALLRAGGYRSAMGYLSTIRRHHVRAGHCWTDRLQVYWKDVKRAVIRDIGPPLQADPFPVDLLVQGQNLNRLEVHRGQEWPAAGVDAIIVQCAWLLREVEASNAVLEDVTLHAAENRGPCGWARWHLPRSKTDMQALGVYRSLSCACPSLLCPVSAMCRVVQKAELVATTKGAGRAKAPLIPKLNGDAPTKKEMAAFLTMAARALDYEGRVTGHSPRVTGAQRMALAGHHVWVIQLFGRWGSAAMLRYVREALLGVKGGNLAEITEGVHNPELKKAQKRLQQEVMKGIMKDNCVKRKTMGQALHLVRGNLKKAFEGDFDPLNDLANVISRVTSLEKKWACEGGARRYVQCPYKPFRIHGIADSESTLCNLAWQQWLQLRSGRYILEGPSADTEKAWCSRCFRKLIGGQVSNG